MAEETVWRGSVSQWKNFGFFVLQILFAAVIVVLFVLAGRSSSPEIRNLSPYILILLALPIFIAGKRYLQTKCTVYELTSERLKTTEGVFNKVSDTLELYRVKDIETRQPFIYRMGGIENVQLNTSDSSSPVVSIEAVPHGLDSLTKSAIRSRRSDNKKAFARSTWNRSAHCRLADSTSLKPCSSSCKAVGIRC